VTATGFSIPEQLVQSAKRDHEAFIFSLRHIATSI